MIECIRCGAETARILFEDLQEFAVELEIYCGSCGEVWTETYVRGDE